MNKTTIELLQDLNTMQSDHIKVLEERIETLKHTIEIDKITIKTDKKIIKNQSEDIKKYIHVLLNSTYNE